MMRRSLLTLALLAVLPAVSAADSFTAFGPRLGFSQGPDQFLIGGHLQWGDVAPQLDFVPGIDLGFGNNANQVSFNGDFHYRIDTNTLWQPYVGGGVGIHAGDGNTAAGGHFIAGADVATKGHSRFFAEMKLGFADAPDFRALAGWSFKPR